VHADATPQEVSIEEDAYAKRKQGNGIERKMEITGGREWLRDRPVLIFS